MKPYYEHGGITIYHGDCREVLPGVVGDSIITDPVWPNSTVDLVGSERAEELFAEMAKCIPDDVSRVAVQLGCDVEPGFLQILRNRFDFFRVCWLEMACPNRKGRMLGGVDIGYLYGQPPRSRPGAHLIPGRCLSVDSSGKYPGHPCPRKLEHVRWLVNWWSEPDDTVIDTFMGSGTTLRAAKDMGRKAIGIEIEEKYCEVAAERLAQEVIPIG